MVYRNLNPRLSLFYLHLLPCRFKFICHIFSQSSRQLLPHLARIGSVTVGQPVFALARWSHCGLERGLFPWWATAQTPRPAVLISTKPSALSYSCRAIYTKLSQRELRNQNLLLSTLKCCCKSKIKHHCLEQFVIVLCI